MLCSIQLVINFKISLDPLELQFHAPSSVTLTLKFQGWLPGNTDLPPFEEPPKAKSKALAHSIAVESVVLPGYFRAGGPEGDKTHLLCQSNTFHLRVFVHTCLCRDLSLFGDS